MPKPSLRTVAYSQAWLLLFLVGWILIRSQDKILPFTCRVPVFAAGVQSYVFQATIQLIRDSPDKTSWTFGFITIRGNSPKQFSSFYLFPPKYSALEITWDFTSNGEEISYAYYPAIIDLDQQTITTEEESLPLNAKNLAALFQVPDLADQESPFFHGLIDFFESAHQGKLPPPNHHGHILPDPIHGHVKHYAPGSGITPLELIWIVGWPIFGFCFFRLRFARVSQGQPAT